MMWQDFVFLAGSVLLIVFLVPTLRDKSAQIPLGSSMPSMTIGSIYTITYATLGMRFSALGSAVVTIMGSLIVCYRSPGPLVGPVNIPLFLKDLSQRVHWLMAGFRAADQSPLSGHNNYLINRLTNRLKVGRL